MQNLNSELRLTVKLQIQQWVHHDTLHAVTLFFYKDSLEPLKGLKTHTPKKEAAS